MESNSIAHLGRIWFWPYFPGFDSYFLIEPDHPLVLVYLAKGEVVSLHGVKITLSIVLPALPGFLVCRALHVAACCAGYSLLSVWGVGRWVQRKKTSIKEESKSGILFMLFWLLTSSTFFYVYFLIVQQPVGNLRSSPSPLLARWGKCAPLVNLPSSIHALYRFSDPINSANQLSINKNGSVKRQYGTKPLLSRHVNSNPYFIEHW